MGGESGYDAQTKTAFVNPNESSGNDGCMNRKRWIILGIVIAILVVAVIVVVVVVVAGTGEDEPKHNPDCDGPFIYPSTATSGNNPTLRSSSYTCPFKGSCWSGQKCMQCLKGPRQKVGKINGVPICCPNCEVRGFSISPEIGCKCT